MNIKHTIRNADGSVFDTFITTPDQSHRVFEHAAVKQALLPDAITIECVRTNDDAIPELYVQEALDENW